MELGALSVEELAKELKKSGVSSDALKGLVTNRVSGKALLVLDSEELKELVPTIGDRALVRNLLEESKVRIPNLCSKVCII